MDSKDSEVSSYKNREFLKNYMMGLKMKNCNIFERKKL